MQPIQHGASAAPTRLSGDQRPSSREVPLSIYAAGEKQSRKLACVASGRGICTRNSATIVVTQSDRPPYLTIFFLRAFLSSSSSSPGALIPSSISSTVVEVRARPLAPPQSNLERRRRSGLLRDHLAKEGWRPRRRPSRLQRQW